MTASSSARRHALFGAVAALAWAGSVVAGDPARVAIGLSGGWTRPAAAGMNAAGYGAITNRGRAADRLIAAASPVASKVSIHESRSDHGVMSMRALSGVAVPAGSTVTLAPGGLHLMLEGLKRPLNAGGRVPITLTFVKAGAVRAERVVRTASPGHPCRACRCSLAR